MPPKRGRSGGGSGGAGSRPDVAARKKKQKALRHVTIKAALLKALRVKALRDPIDSAVAAVTQITAEGSRFLNLLLLDCCERGVPLPRIDLSFVRQVFCRFWIEARAPLAGANRDVIDAAWELYSPERGDTALASFDGSGFGQILTYAAKDYLVACHNHVKHHFYRRIFGLVARRFVQARPALNARNQGGRLKQATCAVVSWIICAPAVLPPDEDDRAMILWDILGMGDDDITDEDVASIADTSEGLVTFTDATRAARGDVLPVSAHVQHDNWSDLLPWLYEVNVENAAHAEAHAGDDDPIKPARLFTLTPINTFDAKFITIDTDGLHGLLRRRDSGVREQTPDSTSAFRAQADEWWNAAFNIDRVLRTGSLGFEFGRMVKTDGVAVNFVCARPKTEEELEDPDKVAADAALGVTARKKKAPWATPLSQWPALEDVNPEWVTGVDPGRRDIVTAVYPRPAEVAAPVDVDAVGAAVVGGGAAAAAGGPPLLPPAPESYVAPSRRRRRRNRRARRSRRRGGERRKRRHGEKRVVGRAPGLRSGGALPETSSSKSSCGGQGEGKYILSVYILGRQMDSSTRTCRFPPPEGRLHAMVECRPEDLSLPVTRLPRDVP